MFLVNITGDIFYLQYLALSVKGLSFIHSESKIKLVNFKETFISALITCLPPKDPFQCLKHWEKFGDSLIDTATELLKTDGTEL